jgi:hypothetical protein
MTYGVENRDFPRHRGTGLMPAPESQADILFIINWLHAIQDRLQN